MCANELRAAQRGSSLIEVLVGIVVALLVGLVAMSAAIGFAATQRQALAIGSVAGNAATALDTLRMPVLRAGLGFFGGGSFRCGTMNLARGSSVLWDGAAFSPLNTTRPATGWSDTLELLSASTVYGGGELQLRSADATGATLSGHLPAKTGQAVLLAPAAGGGTCTVRSITGTTAASATGFEQLQFASSQTDGLYNQASFSSAASYGDGDRISLLGSLSAYRYRVSDQKFQQVDRLTGDTATLARNILAFRVQYGVAAATGNRALDSWVEPTGDWATLGSANIDRVLALRIQLLVRSAQPEKPDARTGLCTATPTSSLALMSGETFPLSESEKCYRHRLVTSVIPLRNVATGS